MQAIYADKITNGETERKSAILAGYADRDTGVPSPAKSEVVKEEIARIRTEVINQTGVKKEAIVELFMEAANMARIMADPMGMVAAGREVGKMLGFYAPETKKILTGVDKEQLKKVLKDLSDEQLYEMKQGRIIDGEATIVGDTGVKKLS